MERETYDGPASGRAPAPSDQAPGAEASVEAAPAGPVRPSATRRVRARIARRMTPSRVAAVPPVLEPLATVHRSMHPKADLALLQRAYDVAAAKHEGQQRKSGDPYITHPLAVATILAELGMDTTTLVAALLHDTVEDTDYSLDKLRAEFGEEVAHLVDGVTKLDKVEFGNAAEAETIRKMVVAMARDPRVLVIKLSDRLHNMRTMRFLPPEKQAKKARETLEVMAPLAHRLGMATVKWELEDLSFAILHPKKYSEIVRLVATRAPSRDTYLKQVIDEVTAQLDSARITATVEGRPKHYYSIYRKMIVKGRDFDDIHDLVGVRVLVDEVRDCYAAMGMVHALWQPMPGRFKDYIAQPRFGVYQSLHTTVIGPDGKPLEVQIRTSDMHRTAEYGIAAHWRYKETPRHAAVSAGTVEVDEMALDAAAAGLAAGGRGPRRLPGVAALRPGRQEIFVFTPKGDVITLPSGVDPGGPGLRRAHRGRQPVHRLAGERPAGRARAEAGVRRRGGDLHLEGGERRARAGTGWPSSPRRGPRPRSSSGSPRSAARRPSRRARRRSPGRPGAPRCRCSGWSRRTRWPRCPGSCTSRTCPALYAAIGEGHASARHVVQRLVALLGGEEQAEEELAERATPSTVRLRRPAGDAGVVVRGDGARSVRSLHEAGPLLHPGARRRDPRLRHPRRGMSVHRTDCTNASDLQARAERLVDVAWSVSPGRCSWSRSRSRRSTGTGCCPTSPRCWPTRRSTSCPRRWPRRRDRVAVSRFTFEMGDPKHLGHVLRAVRNVEGVYDVYRVTSAPDG